MKNTDRLYVSDRIASIPSSPTIAVGKRAQELRRQGVDVVDFGPGEPDFDTPLPVRQAAVGALDAGFTHYPPSRGIPELREAIAEKLSRENGLTYDPDTEIIVTPGAKQALVEAIFVLAGPSDEVIVFDPGWASYDAIVRLAGATPVHVPLQKDFTIDERKLNAAVTPHTRALIVGSPGNPTGHVLTDDELDVLSAVCQEHDLVLVSDEIYERLTYDDVRAVSPATCTGMWERTVTVNGLSKAYAMTGWRLGYAAAPASLIDAMLKVHEHTVTAATSFAQVGAVEALRGPQEPIQSMVAEFAKRRALIVEGLNGLPGVRCVTPEGAFYVFPDISATGMTGTELAKGLLEQGVALTPGAGFGAAWDTHVRLSYATSVERIQTGLDRMRTFLTSPR